MGEVEIGGRRAHGTEARHGLERVQVIERGKVRPFHW
jgi:hypothetical protein